MQFVYEHITTSHCSLQTRWKETENYSYRLGTFKDYLSDESPSDLTLKNAYAAQH